MAARAIGRYPRAATARTARHSRRHCPYIAGERTRAVIVVAPRRACLALVSAHALTRCEAMATQTNLLVATIPAAGAPCCAHTANCLAAARYYFAGANPPVRFGTAPRIDRSLLVLVSARIFCLSLHPSSRPDHDRRSVSTERGHRCTNPPRNTLRMSPREPPKPLPRASASPCGVPFLGEPWAGPPGPG